MSRVLFVKRHLVSSFLLKFAETPFFDLFCQLQPGLIFQLTISTRKLNSKKNRFCSDFVSVQPLSRNLIGCQPKAAYLSEI